MKRLPTCTAMKRFVLTSGTLFLPLFVLILLSSHGSRRDPVTKTYEYRDSIAIATVCIQDDRQGPHGERNTASQYMQYTMANHRSYADVHGYSYFPLRKQLSFLSHKDVRYQKLGWVRQLMKRYSWVFYTDCDSLFIDFCVDVGVWLQRAEQADLIFTGDKNWAMNAGQFIIRNTTWSNDLLLQAMEEEPNSHGCVGNDNAAFNWLLWKDCELAHGDFTTRWNDTRSCEWIAHKSHHADKLWCAPMNTYDENLAEAQKLGPVFRLHFAGSQEAKLTLVKKHLGTVNTSTLC